jgi:hypothetical protein
MGEAVVIYMKALSRHLPGGTEENHEKEVYIVRLEFVLIACTRKRRRFSGETGRGELC